MWRRISTRSGGAAFVLTVLVGLVVILRIAGHDERVVVQSTGVISVVPVATVGPAATACQRPLVTAGEVDAVGFNVVADPPRPSLSVSVRDAASHLLLARGRVPANFDPDRPAQATLDRTVPANRSVSICITNTGHTTAAVIFGDNGHTDLCAIEPGSLACRFHFAHPTSAVSQAYANGGPVSGTMNLVLSRRRPVSVLSQVGAIMHRASTFRPGFVGVGLWWVLLIVAVILVPGALWWGLAGVDLDGPEGSDRPTAG